ncbi:MAG: inorganic diphosphatase [Candidatus Bostrichicola ureolyticus]|nr:MAG: inorganic diphosphatase [Candidatus Bostrichicola ureolyticus]
MIFDVLIEIPKGSRNKYEFCPEKGMIRLDRVLHSTMIYPVDYGYIINTIANDNDPLDALVLLTNPTIPGCLITTKPIGIFYMIDNEKKDDKILCVPINDPNFNKLNDINDVNYHTKIEIEFFFKNYKTLEGKKIEIKGWGDAYEAIKVYNYCLKNK